MFQVVCLASFALLAACAKAQVSITTASGSQAPPGPYRPGQLIFEDNFEELDFEKWEHEQTLTGGGNWEFQWYTNNRSNSYVEDGVLHIAPTLVADEFGEGFLSSGRVALYEGSPYDTCTNARDWGCDRTGNGNNFINPIKSARLRTVNTFAFKYGIVEAKIKLPAGDWIWPAFWMMPKYGAYSSWPSSGEIDILESRGNRALFDNANVNVGVNSVTGTLHFGPAWNMNGYEFANFHHTAETGFNEDFHIYRFGWTDEIMEWSVDDHVIAKINVTETGDFWQRGRFDARDPGRDNPWKRATKMAPFDQQFYIIMNLAVGGTNGYFYDGLRNENGNKPWSNNSPTAFRDFWNGRSSWLPTWHLGEDDSSHMQVEYVRVYAV